MKNPYPRYSETKFWNENYMFYYSRDWTKDIAKINIFEKLGFSRHWIKTFMNMTNNGNKTKIAEKMKKSDIFKFSMEIYENIQNYISPLTILAGGYSCYLEGLTKYFDDINFYVLVDDIKIYDLLHPGIRKIFEKKSKKYQLKLWQQSVRGEGHLSGIGDVTTVDFLVKTSNKQNIFYTITFLKTPQSCKSWIDAAKYVTDSFDLPICSSSVSPGEGEIVRFKTASLLPKYDSFRRTEKYQDRVGKYQERVKSLGAPPKLSKIAFSAIQIQETQSNENTWPDMWKS